MLNYKLTAEQKQDIINSKLTNKELAVIYNVSQQSISGIRIRAGKGIGRSTPVGHRRVSDEHMAMILNPDLRIVDVFKATGVSQKHIAKVRKKNGILGVRASKRPMTPRVSKEKATRVKVEQPRKLGIRDNPKKMIKILDSSLSADEVAAKTGVSKNKIWQIRKEMGIRYKNPISAKIERVKLQASMSAYEKNQIQKKEAEKLSEKKIITDAEKIASGSHHWISRINKWGKTERALVRI